ANNVIHQNLAEENAVVSVRSAFEGRTARASTNKLDDESLKGVVAAAERMARVQHPDPELLPMAGPAGAGTAQRAPSRYFPASAALTPGQRADAVKKMIEVAEKHRLTAAGVFSNSESAEGVFNSRGIAEWHTQTSAEISITMLDSDSSGWQKANAPD